MPEINPGDRVRDTRWGGEYTGTVRRVDPDGDVYVKWDGVAVEDQMSPGQVVLLEQGGSR